MAVTDRLGATVDATEAPSSSTPNAGLAIKTPVRVATTGQNIALSGLQTIDGVALAAGDRILVKDQTNQTTNGIYNCGTGTWAASSDFQNNTQFSGGMVVFVTSGTVNSSQFFGLTTTGEITLGSTALVWAPVVLSPLTPVQVQRSTGSANTITVVAADSIINSNTSANATCTLVAAAPRKGAPLTLKNQSLFTITLTPAGADTIDSHSSFIIPALSALTIVPYNDGVNGGWSIASLTSLAGLSPLPSGGDDSANLQAWINGLQATGAVGVWQAGAYQNNTPLSITSAVTIVGAGPQQTILQPAATINGININTTGTVNLSGFQVLYSTGGDATTYGIQKTTPGSAQSYQDRYENIWTYGAYIGMSLDKCAFWSVDKCMMNAAGSSNTLHGMVIQNTYNSDGGDGCISNSSVVTCTSDGILYLSGGGLKIINQKFSGTIGGACIKLNLTAGSDTGDLLVANSSMEGSAPYGVYIARQSNTATWLNVSVVACQFEGQYTAVAVATDATGAWLNNLTCIGNTWQGPNENSGVAMYSVDSTKNFSLTGGTAYSLNSNSIVFYIGSAAAGSNGTGVYGGIGTVGAFSANSIAPTNCFNIGPITSGDVSLSPAGAAELLSIQGTAITGTSGTGKVLLSAGPTMTTPTLGAATATTINGLAIGSTSGGATLDVAIGKTFSANNSISISGTDGSTLNVGTGGTLGTAAYLNEGTSGGTLPACSNNNTFSGSNTFSGPNTFTAYQNVTFIQASNFLFAVQNSHDTAGDKAVAIASGVAGSTDTTSAYISFYDGTFNTPAGTIQRVSGTNQVGIVNPSDERCKPNRELMTAREANRIVMGLEIWDFDKDGNQIRGYGLLAQQAYKVHHYLACKPQTPDELWGVEKAAPMPWLLRHVQELTKRIDLLEQRGHSSR